MKKLIIVFNISDITNKISWSFGTDVNRPSYSIAIFDLSFAIKTFVLIKLNKRFIITKII